jgi:uncharacterized membrane protein
MKIIYKFRKVFLLLFLSVSLSACLSNVDEVEEIDPGNADPCADITFSMNVKPIIDNNCVSCHSTSGQASFLNLETYNAVAANATKVKSEVVSKDMPIGGTLTNEEISAISCWVDAGAVNN